MMIFCVMCYFFLDYSHLTNFLPYYIIEFDKNFHMKQMLLFSHESFEKKIRFLGNYYKGKFNRSLCTRLSYEHI